MFMIELVFRQLLQSLCSSGGLLLWNKQNIGNIAWPAKSLTATQPQNPKQSRGSVYLKAETIEAEKLPKYECLDHVQYLLFSRYCVQTLCSGSVGKYGAGKDHMSFPMLNTLCIWHTHEQNLFFWSMGTDQVVLHLSESNYLVIEQHTCEGAFNLRT